jgi:cellulose synthase/poly-beta-1,6-N-acetylglucosamine synthase-like glycosyltransferase
VIGQLFWSSVGAVVYAYAGYPLLLATVTRLRRRDNRRMHLADAATTAWPRVSLIIAAYNEADVIGHKLANTLELDYPAEDLQIIVAADGSEDETAAIARTFGPRVTVLHNAERLGKTAAITRAMAIATGEIVLFSDANNLYEPDVLSEIVAPFADPEVGAATGSKVIVAGDGSLGDAEGTYWRYESRIKELEWQLGCCTAVAGEILAVRRSLFEAPPPDVINDDFYIAMSVIKAGYRIAYVPGARSRERVSPSPADEATRRSRIVAGRYQALMLLPRLLPMGRPVIAWQVISHKFIRPLVPLFMIAAVIANVLAVIRPARAVGLGRLINLAPPIGWLALVAQAGFYGLAIAGRSGTAGGRPGRAGRLLYLPAFLVRSNLAALVGLARYARGQQSARWERAARRAAEAAPVPRRDA